MVKKSLSSLTYLLLNRVNSGIFKKTIALATFLGAVATVNTVLGDPVGSYFTKLISTRVNNLEQTTNTNSVSILFLRKDTDAIEVKVKELDEVNQEILKQLGDQNAILQRLDERTLQIQRNMK